MSEPVVYFVGTILPPPPTPPTGISYVDAIMNFDNSNNTWKSSNPQNNDNPYDVGFIPDAGRVYFKITTTNTGIYELKFYSIGLQLDYQSTATYPITPSPQGQYNQTSVTTLNVDIVGFSDNTQDLYSMMETLYNNIV